MSSASVSDFLALLRAQFARAASLLAPTPSTPSVHFVGIAGVGMAGLATLLVRRGFRVTGCDTHPDAPSVPPLRALGIEVIAGHDPAHLAALDPSRGDFVIRTPAAHPASPELAAAAAQSLPVLDRGPVLAALLKSLPNPLIAVCGTHGKTTTATFATQLLRALGLSPGCCIGTPGGTAAVPSVATEDDVQPSSTASPFVAECDESDGSLALYHPAVAVLGSIDFDHAEHFATEADFRAVFDALLANTSSAVVYNADDSRLRAYIEEQAAEGSHPWCPIPVGTVPLARLRATTLEETAAGTSFDLTLDDAPLGRFHLPVPGHHNLLNALAALGALVPFRERCAFRAPSLASALSTLRLPGRRFEVVSTADGVRVVADYAHHPVEIAACLAMARATLTPGARLHVVFQPHRPSRTKALGPQFPPAFAGADTLALAPVYAASEPNIPGGDIADLHALFRATGEAPLQEGGSAKRREENAGHPPSPVLLRTLDEALPWLRRAVRPDDTVLLVGAGDIIRLVSSFHPGWTSPPPLPPAIDDVALEPGASAAPHCSYGVGGHVRALAHVHSLPALQTLLVWCRDTDTPWRILGAGTNLLVSDVGFDGLLLRLEGPAFASCTTRVASAKTPSQAGTTVGTALPGARLLAEWQHLGYSGLECMDGIPGTVGGWLAMNAGAQGRAIGDCLVSLTLLDPSDGSVREVPRSALVLGYRSAVLAGSLRPLSSFAILSAVLAPTEVVMPELVAERREVFRAKRFDFRGLRTAGSVFRNPPGDSAGRLLDEAGFKGRRVGDAFVSDRHANIFCAGPGATASDLLALLRLATLRVPTLVPEICVL